jgi:MULE transposase domain
MHDKTRVPILTDQDQTIENAVKIIFPNTVHHLCLWHITNKFLTKIEIYKTRSTFHKEIIKCLKEPITTEAFKKN